MLRRRTLILSLLMAPLLAGGAFAAATLDDITARGSLVVAVYRDFPPFSYRKGNEVVGVDVDIAKALAKRLGLKPEIMELTAGESVDDDLRNAVWKGHYLDHRTADVMLHVPTDRVFMLRNTNAVISSPYYRERIVVARNPDKVVKSDDISIFEQEKVGVELATLADVYLTGQLKSSNVGNVVHYPSIAKAVDGLRKGEVAAVMGTESEIVAALGKDVAKFPAAPMPAAGLTKSWWELGLAVRDSNRQLSTVLDDAMAALLKDGTIAAAFKRHGLSHRPPEE